MTQGGAETSAVSVYPAGSVNASRWARFAIGTLGAAVLGPFARVQVGRNAYDRNGA